MIMRIVILDYYFVDSDDLGATAAVILDAYPPSFGTCTTTPFTESVRT